MPHPRLPFPRPSSLIHRLLVFSFVRLPAALPRLLECQPCCSLRCGEHWLCTIALAGLNENETPTHPLLVLRRRSWQPWNRQRPRARRRAACSCKDAERVDSEAGGRGLFCSLCEIVAKPESLRSHSHTGIDAVPCARAYSYSAGAAVVKEIMHSRPSVGSVQLVVSRFFDRFRLSRLICQNQSTPGSQPARTPCCRVHPWHQLSAQSSSSLCKQVYAGVFFSNSGWTFFFFTLATGRTHGEFWHESWPRERVKRRAATPCLPPQCGSTR